MKQKIIIDSITSNLGIEWKTTMKAVIQRVDYASVVVDETTVGAIGKGFLVLLGAEKGDELTDVDYLVEKIINLRIFEDDNGKMNLSLMDISGELLVVSQFTLLADCKKGRRPSFVNAGEPELAERLYEDFVTKARMKVEKVETGTFQALMKIELLNNGPVTILLDSRR